MIERFGIDELDSPTSPMEVYLLAGAADNLTGITGQADPGSGVPYILSEVMRAAGDVADSEELVTASGVFSAVAEYLGFTGDSEFDGIVAAGPERIVSLEQMDAARQAFADAHQAMQNRIAI
jgi:hypothetical protein